MKHPNLLVCQEKKKTGVRFCVLEVLCLANSVNG